MANRTIAEHTEEPNQNGWHSRLRVERLSSGAPGLIFIIETYMDGQEVSQESVLVKDGTTLLAPVNGWLAGNDPEPYVDQWNLHRNSDGDPAGYDFDAEFHFEPRPGYNQNREDYS